MFLTSFNYFNWFRQMLSFYTNPKNVKNITFRFLRQTLIKYVHVYYQKHVYLLKILNLLKFRALVCAIWSSDAYSSYVLRKKNYGKLRICRKFFRFRCAFASSVHRIFRTLYYIMHTGTRGDLKLYMIFVFLQQKIICIKKVNCIWVEDYLFDFTVSFKTLYKPY